MADGIAQIGGNGGDIRFQNVAHADAGGDGLYSFDDIYNKSNGAGWKALDGVTPAVQKFALGGTRVYLFNVTLQSGDGVGTTSTILKDSRCIVVFATGKTYLTSAVGVANRLTEWGLKATGANGRVVGYDGVNVVFGTNPGTAQGINGNVKMYGCQLANYNVTAASSRIFIVPGTNPSTAELIDTLVFTLAGTQSFGLDVAGSQITLMRRFQSIGLGAGAVNGHIVQFNCPDADAVSMYWPNGDGKIRSAGYVRIGRPEFIGPSTNWDSKQGVLGAYLNPICSQNVVPNDGIFHEEWWEYGLLVTDVNAAPVAGARVQIWDPFDSRYVVDTVTNARGRIDFQALQSTAESPPFYTGPSQTYPLAPFRNALMVNGHQNDGIPHDHTPFTLYINQDSALSSYMRVRRLLTFPYSTFGSGSKQYSAVSQHIILNKRTAGSGAEDWRDAYA